MQQHRIFGLETEYGITCASTVGAHPPIDAEQAARRLFQPVITYYRSSNVFIPNGGRLYLDVGSHPEYATAECDNLADLLAQDLAGQQLMVDLVAQANQQLRNDGITGRIHLLKNNLDSAGNSCGCHENYLLHRDANFRQVADGLITFFVTRQILVGSGYLDPATGRYGFSQRAGQMDDAISAATTRSRPIINTRDEPLANSKSYRRMHVIVGDSNVSSATTALKIASTLCLLTACELGMPIADLTLANPMQAINQVNQDLQAQVPLRLKDGRQLSALEIQSELFERIWRTISASSCQSALLDSLQLPSLDVRELWQRTLDALWSRNLDLIASEIDWVIKQRLLERAASRNQVPLNHPLILRLDYAYHDIGPLGLQHKLLNSSLMTQVIAPQAVDQAMQQPPATTRAALRGKVIAAARRKRRDLSVDWLHLRLDGSNLPTITLDDPFSTHNQKVDQLLAEMD